MENIEFGCATHAGRVRDHNEDHYSAVPEIGLWIIADGMGGHQAGEIASDIVSRAVVDFVRQGSSLKEAIARSHHAVIGAGEGRKNLSGMGSTVVALQIDGLNYKIAWVGDSRAYMWDGGLKQITHDHSFVQGLIDAGAITEEEALDHPKKSVINQALGALDLPEVQVDTVTGKFIRGQQILLCSDGLTGELRNTRIASILAESGDAQQTVDRLVQAANDSGGLDNITVILVSAPDHAPERVGKGLTRPMDVAALNKRDTDKKKRSKIIIGTAAMLIFALLLILSLFLFETGRQTRVADPAGNTGFP